VENARRLKQVLPDKSFVELPLEHPSTIACLKLKQRQVPNVRRAFAANSTVLHGNHFTMVTFARTPPCHLRRQGRIMVMARIIRQWRRLEREGESDYYFHNFSEKISYPLGINIIFYVMTH